MKRHRQGRARATAAAAGWSTLAVAATLILGHSTSAAAEGMFLAKQYSGCSTCHYSPTGGGLLTPYGRTLWRQEIATFGRRPEGAGDEDARRRRSEEKFLGGVLDRLLHPLDIGVSARPAHLSQSFGGQTVSRNFWMTAQVEAAFRHAGWTAYGELGREATRSGNRLMGYEYWIGHEAESGLGFRVGRFLPAYGIRDADHTAYIRRDLGFDRDDQVLGLELSDRGEHHQFQFSIGPGRAESVLHDDGERALTMTARYQLDLGSRNVLVLSGRLLDQSRRQPRAWLGGVSWGFAPTRRLVFWSELDEGIGKGFRGTPSYTFYEEVSFEVIRGVWLKFSPQLRTELEDVSAGATRYALGVELFPRTHWTLGLTWYRDRDRTSGFVAKTLLLQLKANL